MLVRLALGLIACMSLADMCWAADAELILTHGKIITVDDQFLDRGSSRHRRRPGARHGDGVRHRASAEKPGARVVDLRGKTVIPGLIDGHIHFLRGADFWQSEVRFQGITRRAAAFEALRAKAREVGPDTWIRSIGGWSEDQFSDDQKPFSRQELDAAAPHNPVYLQVGYGRAHANSAAFDKAGINLVDAAKVEAQEIVERDGTGSATGRLMSPRGIARVRRAFPREAWSTRSWVSLSMARSLNALGITAVYDPGGIGVKAADYEPLERLTRAGELPVRVFRALWIDTPGLAQVEATVATIRNTRAFQGSDRYDLVAIGEAVYSPQHDNFRQPLRPSPAEAEAMRAIFDAAAETGLAFHMHAIEHDTAGLYLDLIEQVAKARNIRALRWTLAHVWTLSPDQIVRLRNLGMNVALQSGSSFDATRLRTAGDAGLAMPPLKMVQDAACPGGWGPTRPWSVRSTPSSRWLGQRPGRCRAAAASTTRRLPANRR